MRRTNRRLKHLHVKYVAYFKAVFFNINAHGVALNLYSAFHSMTKSNDPLKLRM